MWKKITIGLVVIVIFFVWNGVGKVLLRKWLEQPGADGTATAVAYTPDQCAYSVTFPIAPEITQLSSPGITFMERAQATFDNRFVRATCMTFSEGDFSVVDQVAFYQMGLDFAEQEGLQSILVEHSRSDLGDKVTISGSKQVQGLSFKVKFEMYHRANVRFTVVAGGLASGYPQSDLLPFLRSVATTQR